MPKKQIAVGIMTITLISGLGFWIAKNSQRSPANDQNAGQVRGTQDSKIAKSPTSVDPNPEKPELYIPELETTSTPEQPSVKNEKGDSNSSGDSIGSQTTTPLRYTQSNSVIRVGQPTVNTDKNPKENTQKLGEDATTDEKKKIKIVHKPESVVSASQQGENLYKVETLALNNKKISSNIDTTLKSVPVNQILQFEFEKPVSEEFTSFLKFSPPREFNRTINGNKLTIAPLEPFAKSSIITFGVNSSGICTFGGGNCQSNDPNAFKITFTTDFKESFSFGKSVEGRDLLAFKFGQCKNDQCKRILLTGGIHGSEWKSGDLMSFKNWLDSNPQEIVGKNREILIIPFTNPDGTAKNQRANANGVNLNRNFPAGWVACAECGSSPASEPETKALVDLTNAFKPNYLISYHAQWPTEGIIFRGNDNNPSTVSFAQWVSNRSGYPVGVFDGFTGSVPGDQVVWGETIGARGIIIESTSIESTDWEKNYNVYLSLLRENY